MSTEYLPVTEVAKHVRKVLKDRFPDTKFSVRSKKYSGGASINVGWTDGPAEKVVQRLVRPFQSFSHVDQTDLAHHNKIEIDGEEFYSGANYINARRNLSAEHTRKAAEIVCVDHGFDADNLIIEDSEYGVRIGGEIATEPVDGNTFPHPVTLRQAILNLANSLSVRELDEAVEQAEIAASVL